MLVARSRASSVRALDARRETSSIEQRELYIESRDLFRSGLRTQSLPLVKDLVNLYTLLYTITLSRPRALTLLFSRELTYLDTYLSCTKR